MGSPYVDVRILRDGPQYRAGAVLRVTAGQAHLWERMGLAERLAGQPIQTAAAEPLREAEAAVAPARRRRGRPRKVRPSDANPEAAADVVA